MVMIARIMYSYENFVSRQFYLCLYSMTSRPTSEDTRCHSPSDSANAPVNSGPRSPYMKLRPLQDRVLIRRVEPEAKTSGGILIPDTAQEKPMEGEVVAVGPGVRSEDGQLHPLDVKTGDRVLFGKWSGTE